MDRVSFSKSVGIESLSTMMKQYYPEINMMYNLIDINDHKVVGHLNNSSISFTVFCDKSTAVSISNRIQDRVCVELHGEKRDIDYTINKNGIDLEFKKHLEE